MQEQNKKNAIFIGGVILSAITVLLTVAMLYYVGKGWWSAIVPLVAEGYGVWMFVKNVIIPNRVDGKKKEDKE